MYAVNNRRSSLIPRPPFNPGGGSGYETTGGWEQDYKVIKSGVRKLLFSIELEKQENKVEWQQRKHLET